MKEIALVLWLVLWPLSCAIGHFYSAKTNAIKGERQLSQSESGFVALIEFIIWIVVAIII